MAKRWTQEEKQILIHSRNQGIPYSEIPLNRPIASMKSTATQYIKEGLIKNCHEHYKSWTDAEDAQLIELRATGVAYVQIEKILGRTSSSIRKRASILSQKGRMQLREHPSSSFSTKLETEKKAWQDEELLDLVRKYRTQDNLNYNRLNSEPSSGPIIQRFGSWTAAVEASGILRKLGRFDKNKLTNLYLVDFGEFYKIGITHRTVEERLRGFPEYKILGVLKLDFEEAWEIERELLKTIEPYKVMGNLPNGNTECFKAPLSILEPFFEI
jgi:hypothetical protein